MAIQSLQGIEFLENSKRSQEELLAIAQKELAKNLKFALLFEKLLGRCIYQEQSKPIINAPCDRNEKGMKASKRVAIETDEE